MKGKLVILADGNDWVKVFSPFSAMFIQYLKATVPPQSRGPIYHERADGKKVFESWRIHKVYLGEVVELLETYFPEQEIQSDLVGENTSNVFEDLFLLVPQEKRGKLYRQLGQFFHPDMGGEEAKMRELNSAYEKLKGLH